MVAISESQAVQCYCCYRVPLFCRRRRNLTNVPRTVSEVESVMAGAAWPVGPDATAEPAAKKACVR